MKPLMSAVLLGLAVLSGCSDDPEQPEQAVRGLKTVVVQETPNTAVRRYPSVLQPGDMTTLSFEVSGRLVRNDLEVGQRVREGEVLVEIDRRSLELAVGEAEASLQAAEATAANAASDLKRQESLFTQEIVGRAKVDRARTEVATSRAQVDQAIKQLETAQENLSKSRLRAPFDGIISSVQTDSFENITAGQTIATLYNQDSFETRFSVTYYIVTRLSVGQPVTVRVSEYPDLALRGQVSELGASAETVSSYPVVVQLMDTHQSLKSGMAIEAIVEVTVSDVVGHAVPVSALIIDGELDFESGAAEMPGSIFVFDEATETVKRTEVIIVGLRENQLIISDGVSPGDRVAVAGVPFLREGQRVRLLSEDGDD